ncbi:type I polyketide synthase [Streptomyces spectabilis]|uniref:Type I polyketide synthase n=1 Tax=Streptomyces spectabilis TaxID=68270 RepID=A0A516R1R5_STRST|nr:type I polyketide synthase [Streptomyces spectabilis]QDQ09604.1 type I polyketide synthase [Streptomyces spectabilis]
MSASSAEPIAIIGMGCRLPGGVGSPAGLWDLVAGGRETVGPVPTGRWDAARLTRHQHPDGVDRFKVGCFVEGDPWSWDPEAFSVAPVEAPWVDPQFRMLMEVSWEAVEHAGLPIDRVRGSRTGVYMGVYSPDNIWREARPVQEALDSLYLFGNFHAGAAGRVAFGLDLRGPVMVVGTHCSSGLVAVDVACTQLTTGDCELALAGAVMLMISPETHHLEAPYLLSQRGHCHAFDDRADGYVRGEGAGALVLKRLADARRDGDRVLAVIRGSGTNNDGRSGRLTAPSTVLQQELFRQVVARADVDPGAVGLVETHGPGTAVGDPVEFESLDAVYGVGQGACALGSIKTNIGHTEPVSGIVGTIKAVQALRHGAIPPNLNFRTWNRQITRRENSRLFVPTGLGEWPVVEGPRLAAVSSYGLVGTNAHLVLEQAPSRSGSSRRSSAAVPSAEAPASGAGPHVYLLSAGSSETLARNATGLADWLDDTAGRATALADLAHTLNTRRWHATHRAGLIAADRAAVSQAARALGGGLESESVVSGPVLLPDRHAGPVFVYTGQGSQWPGMCQGLVDIEPAFRRTIDELEPLVQAESGFSLREMLRDPVRLSGIARVQPTLFAVQLALTELWRSWGVHPAGVIGHSMGEVAAAVVAGALTQADAAAVICRRSALMSTIAGGAMASVRLGAHEVAADLERAQADRVSIAVLAAPNSTVVSGAPAQVNSLVEQWSGRGVLTKMIDVDVASHSAHVDSILDRLHTALAGIAPARPQVPFYSTVSDDALAPGPLNARYWVDNLRRPVRFAAACATAVDAGHRVLIESSPHPLAVGAITDTIHDLGIEDAIALGTLRRGTPDRHTFLTHLLSAHCAGAEVDWSRRYGDGALVELPPTTWRRIRHGGTEPPYQLVAPRLVGADQHPLLGGYVHDPDSPGRHLWQTPVSPARVPWLADHQVAGVPVLSGTAIADMMLTAATRVFDTQNVALAGLTLDTPLVLAPEPTVTTRLTPAGGDRGHEAIVLAANDSGPVVHARATVRALPTRPAARLAAPAESDTAWQDVVPAELYRRFEQRHGVQHGTAFAATERLRLHDDNTRAIGTIRIPDAARVSAWTMTAHPALIDAVVQTAAAIWLLRHDTEPGPVMVAGIGDIRVHGRVGHTRLAHVTMTASSRLEFTANAVLTTMDGFVTAEIDDLRLVNITSPEQRFQQRVSYQAWERVPPVRDTGGAATDTRWLVVAEPDADWGRALAEALGERTRVFTHPLTAADTFTNRLAPQLPHDEADDSTADHDGVVIAVADPGQGLDGSSPAHARALVIRAAAVLARLTTLPRPPRLWIALRTVARDSSPAVGGLSGLIRSAVYECPHLTPSMIRTDGSVEAADIARDLRTAPEAPTEIAWSRGERHLARLRLGLPAPATAGAQGTPVRPDGAYLVTGGVGALGLTAVQWLAARHAGHVVICGWNAPSTEVQAVLDRIRDGGTGVSVVVGDLADPDTAHRALTATGRYPLRGIIHSAGVVDDATLTTLTPELITRVWRGKVDGAWALHEALQRHRTPLDFWVNYSSCAALLGSPGQAAYAAANTWLDEFGEWRRSQGLPATTIQWGAWSDIGRGRHMAERGLGLISPDDGTDALERAVIAGYGQIAYAPVDLERWLEPYAHAAASTLFADVVETGGSDGACPVVAELLAATTVHQRRGILERHIIDCVRKVLGGTTRHITASTSLVILGMDSLGAVQLQNHLGRTLGIALDPGVVWVRPTPAALAEWIDQRMGHTDTEADDGRSEPVTP